VERLEKFRLSSSCLNESVYFAVNFLNKTRSLNWILRYLLYVYRQENFKEKIPVSWERFPAMEAALSFVI